jgi:hypothetical protein
MVEWGHPRAIEHGTTRLGRWLRERRLRLAAWIALVEAILLVAHVIPKLSALLAAAALFLLYVFIGRTLRSDALRHASWIAATSQVLVALVPVLLIVVGTLALIVVGILAVVALVVLFTDRR